MLMPQFVCHWNQDYISEGSVSISTCNSQFFISDSKFESYLLTHRLFLALTVSSHNVDRADNFDRRLDERDEGADDVTKRGDGSNAS